MVEDVDHLEVGVVGQRQHHVAGAEPRVHLTVDEFGAQQTADALCRRGQAIGSGGEREMVEAHAEIVNAESSADQSGVPVS